MVADREHRLREQVLDDDIEFENHVATIELDEDSPVLEGVGLSREITYEAHFEGMLYLSVMGSKLSRQRLSSPSVVSSLLPGVDDRAAGCGVGY